MDIKQVLSSAPIEQLLKIQKQVGPAIRKRQDKERKAKIAELKKLAAQSGISITIDSEVKSSGYDKYINPNDSSQTWSGKGRKPKWVNEHLNSGGNLEDLEYQLSGSNQL